MLTEDLNVYKKAHQVTLRIYEICSCFPSDEKYGLISQMKRSAVSINSNLMEGNARKTEGERKHFIGISRGSAAELQYQITVAKDVNLIDIDSADLLINELKQIGRMLSKLMEIDVKRTVPMSCSQSL